MGSRILEVGCGTGEYIGALSELAGAECTGCDPSVDMLEIARERAPAVAFIAARAEALLVADDSFDFVYSVDVVHHLDDLGAYFAEAARVLVPGGRVCTVTEDSDALRKRLHARYFPQTVEIELARYPTPAELEAAMSAAGFADVDQTSHEAEFEVVDSAPYREKAFSSLGLIAEDDFLRALERLETDLAAGPLCGTYRALLVWGRL